MKMPPKNKKMRTSKSSVGTGNLISNSQLEFNDFQTTLDVEHASLLQNVVQIDEKKKIKPPTRTESAAEVSEFRFDIGNLPAVPSKLEEILIKPIEQADKSAAQRIKKSAKGPTLLQPAADIHQRKTQRQTIFEEVKDDLTKWADVVDKNRVADQLKFPLENEKYEIYDVIANTSVFSFQEPTQLEKEFHAITQKSDTNKKEHKEIQESQFRLSYKEMMKKRQLLAKGKALASYEMAKTKRQNKIKSKKYHRILRKEKKKDYLKNVEQLLKDDPEAALSQIQLYEKDRAKERATLKHRNSGKWARKQMIYAKHNKEGRIAISEQLAIHKELTQKLQVENSDSDSEDEKVSPSLILNDDPNNPWLTNSNECPNSPQLTNSSECLNNPWLTNSSECSKFLNDYQKWNEKNKGEVTNKPNTTCKHNYLDVADTSKLENNPEECSNVDGKNTKEDVIDIEKGLPIKSKEDSIRKKNEIINNSRTKDATLEKVKSSRITKKKLKNSSGFWDVIQITDDDLTSMSVPQIFDTLERGLNQNLKRKIQQVTEGDNKNKTYSKANKNKIERKLREVDESKQLHRTVLNAPNTTVSSSKIATVEENVDPNRFLLEITPNVLATKVPNILDGGDENIDDEEDDAVKHQTTISKVFAEDDIIDQFVEEKEEAKNANCKLIDTLPGWGSWTDASKINNPDRTSKRRRMRVTNKRLLFKQPKAPPRKDSNKGNVIINEDECKSMNEHKVDHLPYPYTKVELFESTLQLPVGSDFIPESAHRKMIAPKMLSRAGTVIEPIDHKALLDRDKAGITIQK